MSVLEEVLADLQAEGDQLRAALADRPSQTWLAQTPAERWDVATQIGHLIWTDEAAIAAATDEPTWTRLTQTAQTDPSGFVDAGAFEIARSEPADLLSRWDTSRARLTQVLRIHEGKLAWFGPPMSPTSMATARLMETWAHALDVYTALGDIPEPTDRIRHIAHLGVRTRDFAFRVHQLTPPAEEFRIELTAPSGEEWAWGPPRAQQRISGSGYDFCLVVTQRLHRADAALDAVGDEAEQWLRIAQAFAGPPGGGRAPTGAGTPALPS